MNKARRIISRIIMVIGGLLIIASLVLAVYCSFAEVRAKISVDSVKKDIISKIPNYSDKVTVHHKQKDPDSIDEMAMYEIYPDIDMKAHNVFNNSGEYMLNCIGVLRIASIGIELPVADEWSYDNLNYVPCRYSGTAYSNGFVICAHNYAAHFGSISNLSQGDEVVFTDVDGNNFVYSVESIDELEPTDIDKMISEDYDLTLFTCTFTGKARIAVRCMRSFDE